MADSSNIEWTDATWNPVVGCTKVSQGCAHCYPIPIIHHRLGRNPATPQYHGLTVLQGSQPQWSGEVRCLEDRLDEPLRWRKPRRIFVNSMSDLFHEKVPDEFIDQVFRVMTIRDDHTFQVLTKRPVRMLTYMMRRNSQQVPGHIWLGVSVEDQGTADERIPLLLQTPAAVRWISAEPLLGPVNVRGYLMQGDMPGHCECGHGHGFTRCPNYGEVAHTCHELDCRCAGFKRKNFAINWVVCGGESGPGARPMHPDWARALRDQCQAAAVPFFFKQWGEWISSGQSVPGPPRPDGPYFKFPDGKVSTRLGKKAAGRLLDGRAWNEYPIVQGGPHAAAERVQAGF